MKSGVFKPDEIRELQYDMGNFLAEWRRQLSVAEAEEQAKFEAAHSQSNRVTPAHISSLKENEVFVFGSNEQGLHHGGAARAAVEHFGAIMGQGSGLQGNSNAIPSMSGLAVMSHYVMDFCEVCQAHPHLSFWSRPLAAALPAIRPSRWHRCSATAATWITFRCRRLFGTSWGNRRPRNMTWSGSSPHRMPVTSEHSTRYVPGRNVLTGYGISSRSRKDSGTATTRSSMDSMASMRHGPILPTPSLEQGSAKSHSHCSSTRESETSTTSWAVALMSSNSRPA